MAEYRYAGPGPHEDPELGLIRPGDKREFDAEPAWGPWRSPDEPEDEPEDGAEPEPEPELTADELGALKKEADAQLAAPRPSVPFLVTPNTEGK